MRHLDLAVLSDLHLGTRHCQADALLRYLHSIRPQTLVLNGDVFDIIAKHRGYWPDSHMEIVRKLLTFALEGVQLYYVTGNHDELIRRCSGLALGSIRVVDRLEMTIADKRVLFVHGDGFDHSHRRIVHAVGAMSYNVLMWSGRQLNRVRLLCGKPPVSLAAAIKARIAQANRFIERFADQARLLAAEEGFDTIVCGHIHHPHLDEVDGFSATYHNCGDWVEHGTALECTDGRWTLHWEPHLVEHRRTTPALESLGNPVEVVGAA